VDCLVAQQFELIGQRTRWWGRWPDLIMAYFPAIDKIGHVIGPETESYMRAVANVDTQIGRICEGLKDIGMYDRTYFCLVSDHGIVAVEPGNVLDIPALLERSTGRRVWTNQYTKPGEERKILSEYDYAVAVTASRWAAVYPLPKAVKDEGSQVRRFIAALDQVEADAASGDPGTTPDALRSAMPPWLAEAAAHRAVEMAVCSFHRGRVHVFTRDAYALIIRSDGPSIRHRVYQQGDEQILEHPLLGATFDREGGSDSRDWLQLTAQDRYPDFVPQIATMFDSERAGNIVFFAADGWDFSTADPRGGHGSVLPGDMRVLLAFAGPGLSPETPVPFARTCDVMPTVLRLLRPDGPQPADPPIDTDGVDLLPFTNSPGH
jgi:arylsulfatase A-like enzyme